MCRDFVHAILGTARPQPHVYDVGDLAVQCHCGDRGCPRINSQRAPFYAATVAGVTGYGHTEDAAKRACRLLVAQREERAC